MQLPNVKASNRGVATKLMRDAELLLDSAEALVSTMSAKIVIDSMLLEMRESPLTAASTDMTRFVRSVRRVITSPRMGMLLKCWEEGFPGPLSVSHSNDALTMIANLKSFLASDQKSRRRLISGALVSWNRLLDCCEELSIRLVATAERAHKDISKRLRAMADKLPVELGSPSMRREHLPKRSASALERARAAAELLVFSEDIDATLCVPPYLPESVALLLRNAQELHARATWIGRSLQNCQGNQEGVQ